jgi:D-psicose/D-tagatose/L-ribulose 3-epimerase
MQKQNFENKSEKIRQAFQKLKVESPEKLKRRLNFSWSNWGFGIESITDSLSRLERFGVDYIELHGNHYGPALGYKPAELKKLLGDRGVKVSGVCGMFSSDNDLSSNRPIQRQSAIDYLKREIEFTSEIGGQYLLVVPGAVGRPRAYDNSEFQRSVETLRIVADLFVQYNIKAAIEPIRSAEVSFVHTVSDAKKYIDAVNHRGVQHINGDIYHMQSEEAHIGEAIMEAGQSLTNLHVADSNRGALGDGSIDLDVIIMALYLLDYNQDGKYVTAEPLGPGGDPYPAMYGIPEKAKLDSLVQKSIDYFREREYALVG